MRDCVDIGKTQHNDSVTGKTEVFFFGGGDVGNGEEPFGFTLTVKVAKPIYLWTNH